MFPFRCCGRVRLGEMGYVCVFGAFYVVCLKTWAVVQKCTCGWAELPGPLS